MAKEPLWPHKIEGRIKGVPTLPSTVTGPASLKRWAKEQEERGMSPRRAFVKLLDYVKESANNPSVWKDGAWKNMYYYYYNKVYDSLPEE